MKQATEESTKQTIHIPTPKEKLKGKEAILSVLAKAAEDSEFLAQLAYNPGKTLAKYSEYYTLTKEEVAALVSGDIRKIEGWCGKLDKKHATWLWCRLAQEKWW